MFSINVQTIGRLAQSLLRGDDNNVIVEMLERKIESLGEKFINDLIGGGSFVSTVGRAAEALKTGGASEFERQRRQWLSAVTPPALPGSRLLNRLQNAFEKNKNLLTRPTGTKLTWVGKSWNDPDKKWIRTEDMPGGGHWRWSKSRQQWLDESFRHDWRTQPRDPFGRWKEGRLRYPYIPKAQRRVKAGRRRLARRMARQIAAEFNRRGT